MELLALGEEGEASAAAPGFCTSCAAGKEASYVISNCAASMQQVLDSKHCPACLHAGKANRPRPCMLTAVPVLARGQGEGGDLLLLQWRLHARAHRWRRRARAGLGAARVHVHAKDDDLRAGGSAERAHICGVGVALRALVLAKRMHDNGRDQLPIASVDIAKHGLQLLKTNSTACWPAVV